MKKLYKKEQGGFLRTVVLLIIGIALASYFFGFSIQDVVEHEQTQTNFVYIKKHLISFYNAYLRQPIQYFWGYFQEFLGDLQNGEVTVIDRTTETIANQSFE